LRGRLHIGDPYRAFHRGVACGEIALGERLGWFGKAADYYRRRYCYLGSGETLGSYKDVLELADPECWFWNGSLWPHSPFAAPQRFRPQLAGFLPCGN
jgi:hypothetical protein